MQVELQRPAEADERRLLEESLEAACLGSGARTGFAWLNGPDRGAVFSAVGLDPRTALSLRGIVDSALPDEASDAVVHRVDAAASLVLSLPLADGWHGALVLGGDDAFDPKRQRIATAVADRTAASIDAARAAGIARETARRAADEASAVGRDAVILRTLEAARLHLEMDVGNRRAVPRRPRDLPLRRR